MVGMTDIGRQHFPKLFSKISSNNIGAATCWTKTEHQLWCSNVKLGILSRPKTVSLVLSDLSDIKELYLCIFCNVARSHQVNSSLCF
jgi:hypothetical protein